MRARAASGRPVGGPAPARGAAVAVLVAALAGGCAATSTTSVTLAVTSPVPTPSPTISLVPPVEITAAGATALEVGDADWMQVAQGRVWTTVGGEVAQQLDPSTGAKLKSVPLGGSVCTGMDHGFGALWVPVCTTPGQLLRIDPVSGKVLARIAMPDGLKIMDEGSVASGEGFVWVVTVADGRSLVKIDPTTNTVVGRLPVQVGVAAARAGEGALWTTNTVTQCVERRDPTTGALVASVPTGGGARFFAVGEGAVWVQNNIDGTVTRVDPATNRAVATIPVDSGSVDGGDLTVGGGFVWARVSDTLVAKIDPATNTVVARYSPASGSGSVAADDRAAWVSAHDTDRIYRLPLR